MIKAIVFDFDGTLADTLPLTFDAIIKFGKEILHRDIADKDFKHFRDKGLKEIIKEEHISALKITYYTRKIRSQIRHKLRNASLFPGVTKLLRDLSKHYTLGILTSSQEEDITPVLKRAKVNSIGFIFSGSTLFGKHRVMKKLLSQKKLKSAEIIYIGDEVRDIEASKKMGIKIISVTWGYNSKKRLEKEHPDFVATKPEQIAKIINSLD
jgi:phosphoglycolate phosphatase